MQTPLILRLRRILDLTSDEISRLGALSENLRRSRPGHTLVELASETSAAILVHEGWAIRHRQLPDGARQILNFALPGDFCDSLVFVTRRADYAITAVTDLAYSLVRSTDVLGLVNHSPRIGAALWWTTAHDLAMLRTHLVAVGRLSAYERLAYLLWELWTRLAVLERTEGREFELPITQGMLADAMGLTPIHVSRMFRRMQRDGLIAKTGQTVRIHDLHRLQEAARISGTLHLEGLPRRTRERLRI